MKRLYVDTETTGFPQREGTPLEECPHIVQLAALLAVSYTHLTLPTNREV